MSRDRKTHGSNATDGDVADAIMRAREAWHKAHQKRADKLGITVEDHIRYENEKMARVLEDARRKEIADEKEGK